MKHQFILVAGIFCLMLLAVTAMAGTGTWITNQFFYQPALGARGEVEKSNFDMGLNRVDAHLGSDKTLGDPGYSTLSEALTTIGSNNVTLTIPAVTVTVASNTIIGSNIALRVLNGGKFSVNSGVALTINGPIDAGPYQIFSGSGSITLGGVSRIYDVWYATPPSTPQCIIAAPVGSRFIKTSGPAPVVYNKESGTGNTGWLSSSGGSGVTVFACLTDVFSSYSGSAGKALRVNSGSTGLEFYTPFSGAFTGLADAPGSYTGQAGKAVRVNSNANGLQFFTLPASGASVFTGLSDVLSSYSGSAGKALRVNSGSTGLEFYTSFSGAFTGLADDASGLEFYAPLSTFTALSDVPSSYTGQVGKSLRVNSSGTGLEFYIPSSGGASVFPGLTDVPGSYSGQAGKSLRVNSAANGLEFYTPSSSGRPKPFNTLGDAGYTSLSEALNTIGSTATTLVIPAEAGVVPITSNTTIPANVDLKILKGGRFDVANGVTLTIQGSVDAGPYLIFSWTGTGAINFSGSPIAEFPLEWYGGQTGISNDCVPAFMMAFAARGSHQTIRLSGGVYRIASPISEAGGKYLKLVGCGRQATQIYIDIGVSGTGVTFGSVGIYQQDLTLKGIGFTGPAGCCTNGVDIYCLAVTMDDVNFYMGASNYACRIFSCEQVDLNDVYCQMASWLPNGVCPGGPFYIDLESLPNWQGANTVWTRMDLHCSGRGVSDGHDDRFTLPLHIYGLHTATLTGSLEQYKGKSFEFQGENFDVGKFYVEGNSEQAATITNGVRLSLTGLFFNDISGSLIFDNCRGVNIQNSLLPKTTTINASCSGVTIQSGNLLWSSGAIINYAADTQCFGTIPNFVGSSPDNNNILYNTWWSRWTATAPDGWAQQYGTARLSQETTIIHNAPTSLKVVTRGSGDGFGDPTCTLDACQLKRILGQNVTLSLQAYVPTGQTLSTTGITADYQLTVPAWVGTTSYKIGQGVTDNNGYVWICSTPGTSGAGTPAWTSHPCIPPAPGDTVTDGGVVWAYPKGDSFIGNRYSQTNVGYWFRVGKSIYIPSNATALLIKVYVYDQNNGSALTAYLSEPYLGVGTQGPTALRPAPNESNSYIQVGANRIDYGAAIPADGRWCNRGDVRYNSNASPTQAAGWMCTTSGTAGGSAVWKAMGNLAN